MKTAIVFDLDGTLIDSAPDIQAAINNVMRDVAADPFDLPTVVSFIGNGVPKLVERAMQKRAIPEYRHAELTQMMLEFYDANPATLTRLYPNVQNALLALKQRGHPLGICTNKPEEPARKILSAFGLDEFFGAVVGGDSLPQRKPDPAPLHDTYQKLGTTSCIYVGDSEVDAETAQRAGLSFALFSKGYRKTPVEKIYNTSVFDDFAELPIIIETLV
ncbi:phosphoglycolate phosphatase [Pseudohalocynthiibacter sp. F2068]|jgi:phosphoglycolate phosphatase|uniref:phosphoglycolate phosphatase n=1 Tax=Pseudohalocynthiibacter sp. F2068 TaxID=2926418 RepID=UPI001FF34EA7|nr:phosphoglycolate phosphatase [Pseudohalocynthiibacter sp. F2068]MCK0103810.1 phosphoglycolate phosphatase [Pseudohalocynthiibacter sp. F2068]